MIEEAIKNGPTPIPVPTPIPRPVIVTTSGHYSFWLDSFQITETRSVHEDTDYVGISLTILQGGDPNRMFQPVVQTMAMGNLNNGTFPVRLAFKNVVLADNDVAIFTYHIINSSQNQSDIEAALSSILKKLTTAALNAAIGAALETIIPPLPGLGTVISSVSGLLVEEFGGLFPGGCDGPVAAGVHSFSGLQLRGLLANGSGSFSQTDNNPGIDSAHGCGANSNYNVTYSIM